MYLVFKYICKKYLVFKYILSTYLVFKYICKKYLVFKYILSTYLVFKYILSMYLVFKYKKVFSAQLWLATSRSNGKSWTEAARPLFPCQTSGLAATKLQRLISGRTARVTWQKRPGRQRLKNARLTGPYDSSFLKHYRLTHTLLIVGNQVLSCSKIVTFNINNPSRLKTLIIRCLLS